MIFLTHRLGMLALSATLLFASATSSAALTEYHIDIRETLVNFTGQPVRAITLNNTLPAPTLEASVGDRFRVTFTNHMDEETSIHWHGVLLPNDQDGAPYLTTQAIAPHSEFTYEFPITHHGTYWYHSHTGLQEQRGVYGALVFHPRTERIAADQQQVLVFSDWTDEDPNQVLRNLKRDDHYYALKNNRVQSWARVIQHGPTAISNRIHANWTRMGPMDLADVGYDAFLVNGQAQFFTPPTTAQKTLRLRMINASASSYLNVRFAAGPMQIIAADGIDVVPIWVNELTLAIAETYDVIVRVPDEARYELRATSVDGSGYSSTWIGSGNTQVTAHDYTPPNPYLMNHNTHGEMTMHETEPSTYGEHNSQGINHTTTHPPMHMPELAPSSHGEHSGHSMDHSPSDSGDMNTHIQPQPAQHTPQHTGEMGHPMTAHAPSGSTPESAQQSLGHYNNLRSLEPILQEGRPEREVLLRLTGSMEGYRWSFNDLPLSEADRIHISRGERVRFVLQNETMMNHPIHLHGHFFRVITDQGDYSPIKHTVNVPSMQTVVIEFDADEEKDWFFHCHNLYHMKSGMSRVVRYDDFSGDPSLPSTVGRVMSEDNRYWHYADINLSSHKTELSAWSFNNRHQWQINAEYDWQQTSEISADYAYRQSRYLQGYVGVDAERHTEESETLAVAGLRYVLPGTIDAELRTDHQGKLRLELGAELILTQRSQFEWFWNTHDEYGVALTYELNKSVALVLSHERTFDAGIGVELRL